MPPDVFLCAIPRREGLDPSQRPHATAAPRGVSLIDVLVGLAVAMLSMVVVYESLVATDALRGNAASAADAQSAAAFALFSLASQVANAGAGWSAAARWLDTCPPTPDIATSLRPVVALILDGGAADRPDGLVVRQTLASAAILPAAFAGAASGAADFRVESPDGFVAGDRVVAISRTGVCATAEVTAVAAPVAGVVDVAHTPVTVDLPATSVLLDLGPAARAATVRFDVAAQTLRSTDIVNGDVPVPLISNVVNLKFLYGIDSDGDGTLDTWLHPGTTDPWSASALLAAPRATLERILAVRIGLIVRSDRVDRALTQGFHWVLFDCADADKSTCPGRLEGTIAGSASGGYRYRVIETIVPLRNVIWNRAA